MRRSDTPGGQLLKPGFLPPLWIAGEHFGERGCRNSDHKQPELDPQAAIPLELHGPEPESEDNRIRGGTIDESRPL